MKQSEGEREQEKQGDSQFVHRVWEEKLKLAKPAYGEGGEKEEGAAKGEWRGESQNRKKK